MTDRIELSDSRGITRILIIVPKSITIEVPSGVPGHRPVTPVTSQIWDDAKIHLKNKDGTEDVLLIDGNHLIAGGGGQSGIVTLRTGDERNTIRLNGSTGEVTVGGNGENGQIFLENQAGNQIGRAPWREIG